MTIAGVPAEQIVAGLVGQVGVVFGLVLVVGAFLRGYVIPSVWHLKIVEQERQRGDEWKERAMKWESIAMQFADAASKGVAVAGRLAERQ